MKKLISARGTCFLLAALPLAVSAATISQSGDSIEVTESGYQMTIELSDFKYSFSDSSGTEIAPAHDTSGLVLNGSPAESASYNAASSTSSELQFSVSFENNQTATVKVFPNEHSVRISVEPSSQPTNNTLKARTGSVAGPFYGLGDDGGAGVLEDISDKTLLNNGGASRFISTFAIAPNTGFAQVAISQVNERFLANSSQTVPHKVSINASETVMGVGNVKATKHFYYFIGSPKEIYQAFSDAKETSGYGDVKPEYGMFGLGWEAWPFEKYHTNASTVENSVTQFIDDYDYPLSWVVIGSGFWEKGGSTVSTGRFNFKTYPDGNGDGKPDIIELVRSKGAKVMFGLRTSFSDCNGSNDFSSGGTDGGKGGCFLPITTPEEYSTGLANNYFARLANGKNHEASSRWFPQWDGKMEILDAANPDAVSWYASETAEWGVDGWKEDTMLTGTSESGKVYHDGAWNAPMKALHERGDYVMARNAYVSSPGSIQRLNDTHGEELRIPQLVLSYAASGAPNVYTDIIGNSSQGNGRYLERHAKLAALTASMSFGIEPWRKSTAANIKAAADWHEKYRPFIYSAALKTYDTGYPYTATPLPIAYPEDSQTYNLDNSRLWQWLIDESVLAWPKFNSSSGNGSRNVYLPEGIWMDMNTHESFQGPRMLTEHSQSGTKIPVFVGGKGIVVSKQGENLQAEIWPIKPNSVSSVSYEYRHFEAQADGTDKVSSITLNNTGWDTGLLSVTDITMGASVDVTVVNERGGINFDLQAGHNYEVSGGGTEVDAGGPGTLPTGDNIALNKPVTVSSTHSSSFVGSNAVDGDNSANNSSRWISEQYSDNSWIEIDLQGNYQIDEIRFWTGWNDYNSALADYTLEYWNGDSWIEAINRTNNSNAVVVESVSGVTGSKIRLSSSDWIKLFEIEVIGSKAASVNLALNKTATATSSHNSTYVASNAVDGDTSSNSSRWISTNDNQSDSIEVDLGSLKSISQIKFWTGWNNSGALSSYQLDYWNGSAWVNLFDEQNNSSEQVDKTFAAVSASKVRLSSNDWIKLYELEVY
ncbi:discoidin domain-containing protein [Endozoicomonas sp. OPT23]|uniref:galactose-binding domain-containing protein n=1 Tax=Endozoicomonas sp. OPT23 TaxID=2072845 RepID=UPI0018918009|nr:discoidin domain-containing protein [Endozoicomonas sp. OPT23]